jgi:hypothetical protein
MYYLFSILFSMQNSKQAALRAIIDSEEQISVRNRHRYTKGILVDPALVPDFESYDALFVYKPEANDFPSDSARLYHVPFSARNVERFRNGQGPLTIIIRADRIPQIFPRDHEQYQEFLEQLK